MASNYEAAEQVNATACYKIVLEEDEVEEEHGEEEEEAEAERQLQQHMSNIRWALEETKQREGEKKSRQRSFR